VLYDMRDKKKKKKKGTEAKLSPIPFARTTMDWKRERQETWD